MKLPYVSLAGALALMLAGCTMKPASPRAPLDATPPAQPQEDDYRKRAYDERLRQRAAEIYRNKGADSYAEAEKKAQEQLGYRPTSP